MWLAWFFVKVLHREQKIGHTIKGDSMHIEFRIKEIRKSKHITLERLSEMTSISKSHLSNIERGEKEPTLSIIVRIALALKVDEKELYKVYP